MFCDKPARRFSHRVFKVFALSLLAVSAVFTSYFLYIQKQRLEVALVDRSRGLGGLLATGAKIAVYSENPELVRETLEGVVERKDVLSAAVFTLDRVLVAAKGRSPALEAGASLLTPREIDLVQRLDPAGGCASLQDGGGVDTFCPVLLRKRAAAGQDLYFESSGKAGAEETVGFVRITLDRRPMQRELRALVLRSLVMLAVILLLGSWAGLHFSRRVTEPLERLTEAVRAFGAGGEIRELPGMPEDEIGRLASAFTNMTRDIVKREREQARLEDRLRHAQKMEAVGTLSQGISHDFKNILSTLKAAVHILQKGSPENEFVLKYTGKIQTSLDRARDLVDRLVTFSRTRQLPTGPVDLSALFRRLAPMLDEAVGEGVRLNLEHPDRPVRILGDAASVEQLMMNLAYNARDAMPEGGILCVRLEIAQGPPASGEQTARISVQDTGVGMDAAVRRRIFEPFFTTKEIGAGMGLGLSIVHGIVEQHRGRIEVESESGAGTLFRIDLPLLAEADAEQRPAAVAAADARC